MGDVQQLKEAILVALLQRAKSGKGSKVTVSLFDAAISSLANQSSNWLMAGHLPQRMGSLHPNIAPYGETFETRDHKMLVLAIGNDAQFQKLCEVLGSGEISNLEEYSTNQNRVINRSQLSRLLQPLFLFRDLYEWMELLNNSQVPAGAVRNLREVFELEAASDLVLTSNIEGKITKRVKTVAFKSSFDSDNV